MPRADLQHTPSVPSFDPPYAGLKVLDLSQGVAGPYCGMILAEQGADVIKVEPPTGDWSRVLGEQRNGMSPLAFAYNVGKRSICVDAQKEEGRELLRRMALQADVVIESFRPGVIRKLGLAYESLCDERPDLVYVSVTGFGQDGPYADRPGSDSTLQALSGMMVVNRDGAGLPRKIGLLVADIATGIYAAQAVGAALYRCLARKTGTYLDISLLDVSAAFQNSAIIDQALANWQEIRPYSVPAGTFETQDGFINVTSLHDRMFVGLCKGVGKDDWIHDPRFATTAGRFSMADEIYDTLRRIFSTKPTAYWTDVLSKHGVVCGNISNYHEFMQDPQVQHRKVFYESGSEDFGPVPVARLPGARGAEGGRRSPYCGEHSREILDSVGLSADEQRELFEKSVVRARSA